MLSRISKDVMNFFLVANRYYDRLGLTQSSILRQLPSTPLAVDCVPFYKQDMKSILPSNHWPYHAHK